MYTCIDNTDSVIKVCTPSIAYNKKNSLRPFDLGKGGGGEGELFPCISVVVQSMPNIFSHFSSILSIFYTVFIHFILGGDSSLIL